MCVLFRERAGRRGVPPKDGTPRDYSSPPMDMNPSASIDPVAPRAAAQVTAPAAAISGPGHAKAPVQLHAQAGAEPTGPGGGKLPWPGGGGAAPVHLQTGLIRTIGTIVRKIVNSTTTLMIVDEGVQETHGPVVGESLGAAGFAVTTSVIQATEPHKSMETVTRLYGDMLAAGVDRESVVVIVGGGLVGDVGGFAAATFMRGVQTVLVPTTLLAMVDASIGGKTGVNLPLPGGAVGKNLAGAFWPPRAIVDDPETLRTLPPRELRCGLAECVKHALVGDPGLLDFIEERRSAILDLEPASLQALLARSIAVKTKIVAEDPFERSTRASLNLGHSFGHALEPETGLDLKHGEAVAIGLCAALRVATARGLADRGQAARVERLIASLGLPVRLASTGGVDQARLLRAMRHDKKSRAGKMRLVLPEGIGRVRVVDDVTEAELRDAWTSVGVGA